MAGPYLESPYLQDESALWLRGNLHLHTTRSDGVATPQEAIRRYAELGHDFLMLSDHDTLFDPAGLDPCGLILLPGNEVSGGSPHVLDVGARALLPAAANHQELLDAINARSGFPVLCHPNWEGDFDHYPMDMLLALTGYAGVEIFNGVVIDLEGNHLAVDKWDRLLSAGKKVWGYANDDTHQAYHPGRGWNVVRAREKNLPAILNALRTGSFYASTGVEITEIRCDGSRLHLVAPNADRIAVVGQHAKRLFYVDGQVLDYDAAGLAMPYIRVECYGRGEQMAWTQPFYIREGAYELLQRRVAEAAGQKGELHALRAEKAPAFTGRLDDPLWQQAPAHERFWQNHDARPAAVRTQLRCILAGNTLVFGVRCEEPLLEQVEMNNPPGGSVWQGDCIEFFLDVEGKGKEYYHIIANASAAAVAAHRGTRPPEALQAQAKTARWSEGARRGWSLELAISLGRLTPAPGQKWGFHVCRNRRPIPTTLMWSWVGGSNHNAGQYGELVF